MRCRGTLPPGSSSWQGRSSPRGCSMRKVLRRSVRRSIRVGGEARTTSDLFAAYRAAVTDMSEAMERPVPARRDRNLRAALDLIHQHYSEPLRFEQVARVAGFAPNYFSGLFREREGMPFERYVTALRIERAKQLLTSSTLSAARVGELSGFSSPQYFSKVFHRALGMTPLEYRQNPGKHRTIKK